MIAWQDTHNSISILKILYITMDNGLHHFQTTKKIFGHPFCIFFILQSQKYTKMKISVKGFLPRIICISKFIPNKEFSVVEQNRREYGSLFDELAPLSS